MAKTFCTSSQSSSASISRKTLPALSSSSSTVTLGTKPASAESSFVPSVQVPLDADGAQKVFKLIDALEDCDDVQNVYANFDVSDEVMEAVG